MVRAVPIIAAAIALVNPSLSKQTRNSYAKTIQVTAKKYELDPFTLVAIAWHESSFRPSVVSKDGEDYGLMQIRARYQKGCRNVSQDSKSCQVEKARLLNGHYSIRRAGALIRSMRKLCRKRTKRPALFHRWMALYAGLNHPRLRGVWCGQRMVKGRWRDIRVHRGIREIVQCRRSLIHKRACLREFQKSKRR